MESELKNDLCIFKNVTYRRTFYKSKSDDIMAIESKVINQPLTNFGSVDFLSVYDSTPAKAAKAGKAGK